MQAQIPQDDPVIFLSLKNQFRQLQQLLIQSVFPPLDHLAHQFHHHTAVQFIQAVTTQPLIGPFIVSPDHHIPGCLQAFLPSQQFPGQAFQKSVQLLDLIRFIISLHQLQAGLPAHPGLQFPAVPNPQPPGLLTLPGLFRQFPAVVQIQVQFRAVLHPFRHLPDMPARHHQLFQRAGNARSPLHPLDISASLFVLQQHQAVAAIQGKPGPLLRHRIERLHLVSRLADHHFPNSRRAQPDFMGKYHAGQLSCGLLPDHVLRQQFPV